MLDEITYFTMILKGITRFKAMHNFLISDPYLASACGFKEHVPDRTTLARRFKALYAFVKEQIQHMGNVLMLKKTTAGTMCSVTQVKINA